MSDKLRSVLVVDDSKSLRMYLEVILERSGYDVRTSSDGSSACWEIVSDPPDCVISDWQMPDMDGVALCQWMRQQDYGKYIYFMLMTAYSRFFDVAEGLDSGADQFLTKPIESSELLARLRCGERMLQRQMDFVRRNMKTD